MKRCLPELGQCLQVWSWSAFWHGQIWRKKEGYHRTWHRSIRIVPMITQVWHCVLTPFLASKGCRYTTQHLQSLAQLRQTSLQMSHRILQQLKARLPKLCNWLQYEILVGFWHQIWRKKTMTDMESGYSNTDSSMPRMSDTISCVKNRTHFYTCNQSPNFDKL